MYLSDIQSLIDDWTDRLRNPVYDKSYKDALNDCIFDLNTLIVESVEEEMDAYEAFKQQVDEAA